MNDTQHIPIFPLNTVLFPGGCLPLRIFEPRYLDMVSQCMKTGSGFGICLIKEGKETGQAAKVYDVGTLCDITYFNTQADGLLSITATGKQRFKIVRQEVRPNQLTVASVNLLDQELSQPVPAGFTSAVSLLEKLFEQLGQPYKKLSPNYECASWVSSRLTELLPFDLHEKQTYLELDDPIERLNALWKILKSYSKSEAAE